MLKGLNSNRFISINSQEESYFAMVWVLAILVEVKEDLGFITALISTNLMVRRSVVSKAAFLSFSALTFSSLKFRCIALQETDSALALVTYLAHFATIESLRSA